MPRSRRRRNVRKAAPRPAVNDEDSSSSGRENAWDDFDRNYHRPENAPDFDSDCPICLEPLFDSKGLAAKGKDVAKMLCLHLVHSDCLAAAGKALNADGQRYGIGGFGPRSGCPICGMGISSWFVHKSAAAFPIFWMHRIQACMEEIGPEGGLVVPVESIKNMLHDDASLTGEQKEYLDETDPDSQTNSFIQALSTGNSVWVVQDINGGPQNGGSTIHAWMPGCWDWDREYGTLWLYKWGTAPKRRKKRQSQGVLPGLLLSQTQ